MSARCSISPTLHLEIASSRIRRLLCLLICLATAVSLYRLSLRGYPLLALLLLPAAGFCCWRLAAQPLVGARLRWRQGEWTLERGSRSCSISIQSSRCLPWLIYVAWVEGSDARRSSVFLFPDSACADQLRQLRVRLALAR